MMNNISYKELYELEKQQRVILEEKMKDIVNRIVLETIAIAEDAKINLLKADLNRIQQEISRLEVGKRERVQQHLLNSGLVKTPTAKVPESRSLQSSKQSSSAAHEYLFGRLQGTSGAVANNSDAVRLGGPRCESAFRVPAVPASAPRRPASTRAPSRAPRKRKSDPVVQSDASKVLAMPPQLTEKSAPIFTPKPTAVAVPSAPATSQQVGDSNSQPEDTGDVEFVEATESNGDPLASKSKFYCSFCGTDCTEQNVIEHLWEHVNVIKQMHTFECTVEGCHFKSNYTKEALSHKKSSHSAEENCKIVDRRDQMSEYFKQCMCKYLQRLDAATAEQVFASRHAESISAGN